MKALTLRNWKIGDQRIKTPSDVLSLLEKRQGIPETNRDHFYQPSLQDLRDPFLFRDMTLAVETILAVRKNQGHILVYGDYDCDGLTATTVLTRGLRQLGLSAEPFIPNRFEDGYGLSENGVAMILDKSPDLVITVDCGSSSGEAVNQLMEAGIPVIITDHHQVPPQPDRRPYPLAFINPCDPLDTYPFKGLAGVGVALKLVMALNSVAAPEQPGLGQFLTLAALGTVADSMPLVDENRTLVQLASLIFSEEAPPGLRALVSINGQPIQPEHAAFFSFGLAPRLNAAGRLGQIDPALSLLLTDDWDEAQELAQVLEALNDTRRSLEKEMETEALSLALREPIEQYPILILGNLNWNSGIVGIVSAHLVDRLQVPVICFGGLDGMYKGSGRTAGSFDLLSAIRSVESFCLSCGGHRQAVGVSVSPDQFESFKKGLQEYAASHLQEMTGQDQLDLLGWVNSEALTEEICDFLQKGEPYGRENETPLLGLESAVVESCRLVGADQSHLSLILRCPGGTSIEAIGFRMAPYASWIQPKMTIDVAGTLQIHEWKSRRNLQLVLTDLRPCQKDREQFEQAAQDDQLWRSGVNCSDLEEPEKAEIRIKAVGEFWSWLQEKVAQDHGHLRAELGLLAQAFSHQSGIPLTLFGCCRLLDIFQEAHLIQWVKGDQGEVVIDLQKQSEKKPKLSQQPTWKRLQEEGGIVYE